LRSLAPGISAFSAVDGSLLWSLRQPGRGAPVIIGNAVYLFRAAYDLRTGEPICRRDPLTGKDVPMLLNGVGGCSTLAGCPGMLMRRSGSLGFIDLAQQSGVYHFPNVRASCWINMIPACGLVLVPEGSSSCPCAYNYKGSLAFISAQRHNHWGLFWGSEWKEAGRISSLRLNFGAPGEKPDKDGAIWYAFPRPFTVGPRGAGGMLAPSRDELPVELLGSEADLKHVRRNPDWTPIAGTDRPWLHSCELQGPVKLQIRLAEEARDTQDWTVRLFFSEWDDQRSPARFDVKLQGQIVLPDIELRAASGGQARAMTRELSVSAADMLTLELIPHDTAQPRLAGLEICAQ
jgi:hypothetical protein